MYRVPASTRARFTNRRIASASFTYCCSGVPAAPEEEEEEEEGGTEEPSSDKSISSTGPVIRSTLGEVAGLEGKEKKKRKRASTLTASTQLDYVAET